jgi:hypothetical protein
MGPLGFGDGVFDGGMIDSFVIVSLMPLVIKIDVGASGDCENYVMSGKAISWLQRPVNL